MKRNIWLSAILLVMLTLLISACSNTESETSNNKAASPTANNTEPTEKPVNFSMFVEQSSLIEDINTNAYTKHLEDKLNIKFDFVVAAEPKEMKPLLLASGDYPEVFFSGNFSTAEILKYGRDGVLIPLNDLIEKYAPNIQKAFSENEYVKNQTMAPDGNIYAIPDVNECYHCWFSQKLWIYTPWLEDLNLEMPTTTDEFYKVLKAFKENDLNGKGAGDVIPMIGTPKGWQSKAEGFLMNAFMYYNGSDFVHVNNGKAFLTANTPEWKEGLTYINKLYSEGLIHPQSFTMSDEELQVFTNENPNKVGVVAYGAVNNFVIMNDEAGEHQKWEVIPPIKGPNGTQLTANYKGIGNLDFAITDKSTEEQRIAAIKMMDYIYSSEGTMFAEYGTNHEFYEDAQPGDLDFNGNPAVYKSNNNLLYGAGKSQNYSWANLGAKYRDRTFREADVASQEMYKADNIAFRLHKVTEAYEPYAPEEIIPSKLFIAVDKIDQYNQLHVQIKEYIESNTVQFLTGKKNISTDWDSYVKGLENLKVEEYIGMIQEAIK